MSKYKRLFSDVGLFTFSNFGSKVLVFLLVPLYTNILSTHDYGIVDLINATINALFPVLTLAIYDAVLRFALDKQYSPPDVLVTSLTVLSLSMVLLVLAKPMVLYVVKDLKDYWWFFIVIYIGTTLNTLLSNYVRGVDKVKVFAIKGILYTLVFSLLNIAFLVLFKLGLQGYLYATIISEIVTCGYMILHAEIKLFDGRFHKALLFEMLKYSIPLIPAIVAWWVMQLSDKYMIIYYLGISESGVYGISYKIPTILSMLTGIFTQAWQISAIKSVDDEDNDRFVSSVYKFFTVFSVAACSVLIISSKFLGTLLYKKDYFVAWKYVPILLVAYLFSGLSGVLASLFSAKKKTGTLFHSTVSGAVVNIVLNLLLIPYIGAVGAAITTMIGFIVTWMIRMISVKRLISLETNQWRDSLAFLLIIAEAVVMTVEMKHMYVISIILIIACMVVYWKPIFELACLFKVKIKRRICK